MNAIAAYMASRSPSRESDNRRNEYSGNEPRGEYQSDPLRREYENRRREHGGEESRVYNADRQRQPNQYPARNAMGEYWPEGNEMQGGGDGRGREMNEYVGAESRYRGRDGRWKAGRRRSEYDGGAYDNYPMDRRMGGDDDEEEEEKKKYNVTVQPKNVIQWPYMPGMPHMPPDSRMIGFGNRPKEYETRSHYGHEHMHENLTGGKAWMDEDTMPVMDRETAEKWVRSMKNEDNARPSGGRWSMEELKPMAQKMGYNPDPEDEEFIQFWAMTNAMYSDYCTVAKKFNITSPEFYGMMAKAWLDDKDAMPNKTALYYECCVKK